MVAARRSDLGLTQEQLAERMDTSRSSVARIEAGQPLSAERRKRLTDALSMERESSTPRTSTALIVAPRTKPAPDQPRMPPRLGVGLVAATVAALWLSVIFLDARWSKIGVAAAIVAALWLSALLEKRGASARVPGALVATLWLSVITVGFISTGDHLSVSTGHDDATEFAIAAPRPATQAQDGATLPGVAAVDGGQAAVVSAASQVAPHSREVGRCNSRGSAADGPAKVLGFGIDPFPWTGAALVSYIRSGACGAAARFRLAGLRAATVGKGLSTESRAGSPATDPQGLPITAPDGSPSAGDGGSPGDNQSPANTLAHPGSGGGGPIGNSAGSLGNTVNSLGNTVSSVGQVLKRP